MDRVNNVNEALLSSVAVIFAPEYGPFFWFVRLEQRRSRDNLIFPFRLLSFYLTASAGGHPREVLPLTWPLPRFKKSRRAPKNIHGHPRIDLTVVFFFFFMASHIRIIVPPGEAAFSCSNPPQEGFFTKPPTFCPHSQNCPPVVVV